MYSLKDVELAYSHYIPSFDLFFKYLRKTAIAGLDLNPGDKVLDIACGAGQNFKYIEQRIGPTGSITAVDYSQAMLKAARKNIDGRDWENINLIRADAAKAKYPAMYDAIISTLGFSSIPDHKKALINAVRSLKKGGRLVILDGKLFAYKPLNILMPILRWNKSWDKDKDIISDVRRLFPKVRIKVDKFRLGSNFILELRL